MYPWMGVATRTPAHAIAKVVVQYCSYCTVVPTYIHASESLAGVLPSRLAQPARDARVFDLMCGAEDHGTVYVFFSHVPYLWVQNEKTKSTDEESYGNL